MKLVETASKWGNLYRLRYFLDGRRISDSDADEIIKTKERKKIKDEQVSSLAGWRTTWEIKT